MTDKFSITNCIASFIVKIDSILPRKLNKFLLFSFRGVKGKIGIALRYILIKNLAKKCGHKVVVKEDVVFDAIEMMEFGNNISINPFCYLAGEISISDNVAIANHTSMHSANHLYDNPNIPIKAQGIYSQRIYISDDVWIASGCRILSGVKVGQRVVIAAGSVVVKDIPSKSLVAGVPAKVIKAI